MISQLYESLQLCDGFCNDFSYLFQLNICICIYRFNKSYQIYVYHSHLLLAFLINESNFFFSIKFHHENHSQIELNQMSICFTIQTNWEKTQVYFTDYFLLLSFALNLLILMRSLRSTTKKSEYWNILERDYVENTLKQITEQMFNWTSSDRQTRVTIFRRDFTTAEKKK